MLDICSSVANSNEDRFIVQLAVSSHRKAHTSSRTAIWRVNFEPLLPAKGKRYRLFHIRNLLWQVGIFICCCWKKL